MSLYAGKISELCVVFIIVAALSYYLYLTSKGKKEELRRMAQVDAISDLVDRAVEEGKPLYFSAGDVAYLSGMYAIQTVAGMNTLRYTSRLTVRKGARQITFVPINPEAMPLMDGIIRESAALEGKPEAYKREDIMYFGKEYIDILEGTWGTFTREGISSYVIVGAFTGSGCTASLQKANLLGASIVGGTARYGHNNTFAINADYPMFSDDIYACSAICSGRTDVTNTLAAGDLGKIVFFVLFVGALILAAAGLAILDWLKL